MRRVHWVKNPRRVLRAVSFQAMSVASAIIGGWSAVPPEWQALVPSDVIMGLVLALLVVGIVGRFIDQGLQGPPADGNARDV
jgi:peptidoglycan/LPS O-acetylase OafA/YrhL